MILHKKKYYLTKSNTYLRRIAWQWNPRLLKHHPNHTFCVYGLMLYISDNKYRSKRRVDPIYQESAKCSLYPNCSPPWNLWVGTVELRAKNVQCSSFPCDPHIPANKKMKTQIARQRIKQKKKDPTSRGGVFIRETRWMGRKRRTRRLQDHLFRASWVLSMLSSNFLKYQSLLNTLFSSLRREINV